MWKQIHRITVTVYPHGFTFTPNHQKIAINPKEESVFLILQPIQMARTHKERRKEHRKFYSTRAETNL